MWEILREVQIEGSGNIKEEYSLLMFCVVSFVVERNHISLGRFQQIEIK